MPVPPLMMVPLGPMATRGVNPLGTPTAPDSSHNGDNAPPEFPAEVGLPADGSGLSEAGAATDTRSGGTNGAPTLQSPLYHLFYCGNAGSGWRLALAIVAWNAAWTESFVLVAAGGGMGMAPWASPPPAALAALPVIANQDAVGILPVGRITKGVAQCTLSSLPAGEITEIVAQRAPGPLLSHAGVETAVMATAALAARPSTAVCTDGCAGGTCSNGHAQTFVPAAIIAAMAPVVANPYLNSASGTAADTDRVVGGAVVDDTVPGDATTAIASTAKLGAASPAGSHVQGVHGYSLPSAFMEEDLQEADPQLQQLTTAYQRLLGIFGDTVHLNNGNHLDGGIGATKDAKWHQLYNRGTACSLPLYNLPNGWWANRFLTTLTNLWVGVIQRCWNLEWLLVFQVGGPVEKT
jgi:hypothetical protein